MYLVVPNFTPTERIILLYSSNEYVDEPVEFERKRDAEQFAFDTALASCEYEEEKLTQLSPDELDALTDNVVYRVQIGEEGHIDVLQP
ncbi:hypothetical protein [Halobaculum limi]|uniref:hypothetical protein n=1 Tax=Halobaculum limi TaxID=3031916 RepID=UPI0024060148|nr:hypothetical protein [Halobaculum sp. YSMS11]